MFFFIGGIQPKTRVLDEKPALCPSCGLLRARYIRIDHYLSLFFIPVIPVKKGAPFLYCDRCRDAVREAAVPANLNRNMHSCNNCGRKLEPDFKYCPFCGKSL